VKCATALGASPSEVVVGLDAPAERVSDCVLAKALLLFVQV